MKKGLSIMLLVVLAACALRVYAQESAPASVGNLDDALEIRKRLEATTLNGVTFKDEPLADVLNLLSELTATDFVLSSLAQDREITVTLSLNKGTNAKTLLEILEKVSGVRFYVADGVIMVHDKSEIVEKAVLEMYYVENLEIEVNDNPGPVIGLGKTGGGAEISSSDWTPAKEEGKNIELEDLPALVMKYTGEGGYWDEDPDALVEVRQGMLLVRAIPSVQKEVKALLEQLRQ